MSDGSVDETGVGIRPTGRGLDLDTLDRLNRNALLKDLKADFDLPFEESADYHTLAGFLLARLKRIPRGGEWVEDNGYKLTIVDMEGRRIVKIKLEPSKTA